MNFPNFMAHTERAFDNVLLVYCAYQRACFGTVIVVVAVFRPRKRDKARLAEVKNSNKSGKHDKPLE